MSEYATALETAEKALGRKPTADEVAVVLKLVDAGRADSIEKIFAQAPPEIADEDIGIYRYEPAGPDGVRRI